MQHRFSTIFLAWMSTVGPQTDRQPDVFILALCSLASQFSESTTSCVSFPLVLGFTRARELQPNAASVEEVTLHIVAKNPVLTMSF